MSKETYNDIFVRVLGVDNPRQNAGITMESTGQWSSLAHMELMAAVEEAFDVMLSPDEVLEFDSYDKGIQLLTHHGITFES